MDSGFLLIDKPVDWTSYNVVGYIRNIVRKATAHKKIRVGHAGTLDPFATGLLIVGVGREATKRIDEFKNMKKEYIATLKLGYISDTYDSEGTIKQFSNLAIKQSEKKLTKEEIDKVSKSFLGKQKQIPPMFSAKKIGGERLYTLARKGIEIERKPNKIEVYNLEFLEFVGQLLSVKCQVSTGTYIRSLAHDIGQKLSCGAYCQELRRTKIGEYSVDDAILPKELTIENYQSNLFNNI
ncbi:MAG: tRNA pseudouridine(55) synthase TruB [Candidatus Magasanikbacteria bacterium CG_4_10_14_0_2_um_filter_37_12]|uniref:tRNA pseudouridine synthase B n=1 Tax=Candidatus Magasanikbacteria bacterium CG_4_10_14_0_2_um_filter_37_12 TaxID=1974637 RepID=A0A2M7V7Y0_9BACT|nr:MAG: tRNA pseudouridine(55) synthase TruB [Candidatus Magasanikbacteria bacterium CG_4_10_14_0_2_um_filter_37_12]